MLEDKARVLFRGLLSAYYKGKTSIAPEKVEQREFGFGDFENKIAYRHYAFKNEKQLNDYLVGEAPPFVSYSQAFYEKPDARPMESKKPITAEMVFDLDADDLNLSCKLQHGNAWVCENCLEAVKSETIKLIEDFLMPDFGFSESELRINFSGNRGYHVHIGSAKIGQLSQEARKEMSDYITANGLDMQAFFPTLGMRGLGLRGPKPTDYGWGGKFARGVIGIMNSGAGALEELGVDKKTASLLARKRAGVITGITAGNWDVVSIPKKAEFWSNLLKKLAIKQSDSIDKNVTIDMHHLIRLPNTIHGDTGLIAKDVGTLKDLERFNPMDDAIAFREGTLKVRALKVPKFYMGKQEFGPYDNAEAELPTYAALYLVLKRVAVLA
ncbi:MAG: DNA primase small subunit domain-containing protein [Candidatus Micrarchaeaceae archaeon]